MEKENLFQWNELEPMCIIRLVWHKLWLVILAALTAMMLASMVLTNFVTTEYTCSVTFSVSSRSGSVSIYADTTAAKEVAGVYSELLTGRLTTTVLREVLGTDYNATLSASQQGETNLLKVTATSDSPRDALDVIQTIIDRQSDLSGYVSDSAVLNVLNTPIISKTTSAADKSTTYCLLAGLVGAAAVVAALFLLSATSGTVQNRTGAKNNVDARILASIPHEHSSLPWYKRTKKQVQQELTITSPTTSFGFTEAIHRLAIRLEHENSKGKQIFLFSSVTESEGKSTIAANIALSLASKSSQVLFIDLDLRRPVQYKILDLKVPPSKDLSRLLASNSSADEILKAVIRKPKTSLDTLLSARSNPHVVERLSSVLLKDALQLARQKYDYIIIDSPPLGYFSDSEILSDLSDASVLVVRQDVAPAAAINDAIDALNAGHAECLGVVLNDMLHFSRSSSAYGYGYGGKYLGKYGRYGSKYGYGKYGKYGKYGRYGYGRSNAKSDSKTKSKSKSTNSRG